MDDGGMKDGWWMEDAWMLDDDEYWMKDG